MFAREAHRVVQAVLGLFRADVLRHCRFLFGGGTRIVLDLGEYRESKDIDFLCSDPQGYSDLRFDVSRQGYLALFTAEGLERIQLPREMRIDQYGIRFTGILGTTALRIELIREPASSSGPESGLPGRLSTACRFQTAMPKSSSQTRIAGRIAKFFRAT
jgi:hypothetical protein